MRKATARTCVVDGVSFAIPAGLTLAEVAATAAALNPELVGAIVTETEDGTVLIQRRPAPGDDDMPTERS